LFTIILLFIPSNVHFPLDECHCGHLDKPHKVFILGVTVHFIEDWHNN